MITMKTKFYIGPMAKNVVDAIIEINNENNECVIGFIPSRRQIEHDGGYVNNWTTKEFSNYLKDKSAFTLIKRDHGGVDYKRTESDIPQFIKNRISFIEKKRFR